MNIVRKLRIAHMYLMRNGYSDAAEVLWLILVINRYNQASVNNWLNTGSYESVLNKILFLFDGLMVIKVKAGFKSLSKLLAVLPKG